MVDPRRGGVDLAAGGPLLEAAALLGGGESLPGATEAVDRRVVGAAGEAGVAPGIAVYLQGTPSGSCWTVK